MKAKEKKAPSAAYTLNDFSGGAIGGNSGDNKSVSSSIEG